MTEVFLGCGSAYPIPPEYLCLYYLDCLAAGVIPNILEKDTACQWRKMNSAWNNNEQGGCNVDRRGASPMSTHTLEDPCFQKLTRKAVARRNAMKRFQ
jgi:hypothetical protein